LVLLGEPGSGKTHISIAVGNELIKQGVPTLYFQHVEGMKELVNLIREDKSLTDKISAMKQVGFLIWDDLFKPTGDKLPKSFPIETAFEVLNYRYLNQLPTAINSERTAKELLEIDKAVGSRIIERGKGFTVTAKGIENNYRLI
jgi:DNA replication protein DnaC